MTRTPCCAIQLPDGILQSTGIGYTRSLGSRALYFTFVYLEAVSTRYSFVVFSRSKKWRLSTEMGVII